MGGDPSAKSNEIAQASLEESRRQYAETRAKEDAQKATAKANAGATRVSGNMAYSNNYQQSTDFTTGHGGAYSLLTAGGTQSIIGDLLGTGIGSSLGG